MSYRYTLDDRYGKEKITCPCCKELNVFTRFYDITTGEILPDEYGMCDRKINCAYVNRPPKNYIIDEESDYVAKQKSIYDSGFLKENWIPENEGMNNNLTSGLINLFSEDKVLPVLNSYQIVDFYDGGTVYPYTLSNNLISGKIIFYNGDLKRVKGQDYDVMWLHGCNYTDKNGVTHFSKYEYQYITKIYPLFGWDLIKGNDNIPICVVEGEKSALICSIVFPEFLWLAAGSLQGIQSYKFPEYNSRVWLFFPDLEPKQEEKSYFDYWSHQLKRIKTETGYKLKYSAIVDYTTNRTEQEYYENKGDIADILIDYRKWDYLAETEKDRMHGKLENYRNIILKKIYKTIESI